VDGANPGVVEKIVVAGTDIVLKPEEPDTFLYASTQVEMAKAQDQLIAWATNRVSSLKKELKLAKENLDIATKRKWKKGPFEGIVLKTTKRVNFYEKVEAALRAGYTIIPDMDVELFAVRTTRKKPKANTSNSSWGNLLDQKTSSPAKGEGRFVDPQAYERSKDYVKKHEPGKAPEMGIVRWATEFDEEIDFPFKMARPTILNATAKAMSEKVFDEVGCLPRTRRQPDPVIVGRITLREGSFVERRFNFLISWFIDTKEM
jgi:hypothetical protein